METKMLKVLYRKVWDTRVEDFPACSLSSLLHGYLSVYSLVRVYPWLEEDYKGQWDIYERVKEIAGVLSFRVEDVSISTGERVGDVADLMDSYLTYSDMVFLDKALSVAYGMLSVGESGRLVLPCRTPEMVRVACSCFYFTGDEACAEVAGELAGEWAAGAEDVPLEVAWRRARALDFYDSTMGRSRAAGARVAAFRREVPAMVPGDLRLLALYFDILSAGECVDMCLK